MRLYQNHFFTSQAFGIWTVCTVDDIRKTASTLFYNYFYFSPGGRRRREESWLSPRMLGVLKSVAYYGLNLTFTILMTTIFTLLNANIGPPSLGKGQVRDLVLSPTNSMTSLVLQAQ